MLAMVGWVAAEVGWLWKNNLRLSVVNGVDVSYAGRYMADPRCQKLARSMSDLRARSLETVQRRTELGVKRADRIVVRLSDGPAPVRVSANTETHLVNGRRSQVVTLFLQPILDERVDVERNMQHEMVHALMRQSMGWRYASVPQWLREGVALWTVGQVEEKVKLLVSDSKASGRNPVEFLNGLETLPHTMDDYPEDGLAFAYVQAQHGEETVRRIIHGVVRGEPYRVVFERETQLPWKELQRLVHEFGAAYVQALQPGDSRASH